MQLWLKYGLMNGVAGLVFTLTNIYFLKSGMGAQFLIMFVVSILFSILVNRAYQTEYPDHDHGYGQTFKLSFLTLFIGSVISTIGLYFLIKFIDPGIYDTLIQFELDFTRSMMESFGMPEDQLEEAMMAAEEQAEKGQYDLSTAFVSIAQSLGIDLIFAALISVFVKKKSKV